MTVSRFERKKTHCNIGIIGQDNHGKTTLADAIAKTLYQRLDKDEAVVVESTPEENVNGIAVSAVCVECESPERRYTYVDCQSHADCVKNIITGVHQMDAALLVVDAASGVTEQAKEQIALCRNAGIPYIAVFINKCDLAEGEDLFDMDMEIRDFLSEYEYPGDDLPIVCGSALKALEEPESEWGDNILELIEMIDAYIPDPESDAEKPFLMAVEDVFHITGRGTVAVGKVESGVLRLNDRVEIVGLDEGKRTVVVTGLEMFRRLLDEAQAGDEIGALLRGVERSGVRRGQVLAKPGAAKCYTKFTAPVYVLTEKESGFRAHIADHSEMQFLLRTADVAGIISLPEGKELCQAGDYAEMTIVLEQPVAMEQGLVFTICEDGRTVGVGRVAAIIE